MLSEIVELLRRYFDLGRRTQMSLTRGLRNAALAHPETLAEATQARAVVSALAEELAGSGRLVDRDAFRALAARVRNRTGQKGKSLFHPIRLVLTGEPEGIELDVAVPAIERGASLNEGSSGIVRIIGARERAEDFARALDARRS